MVVMAGRRERTVVPRARSAGKVDLARIRCHECGHLAAFDRLRMIEHPLHGRIWLCTACRRNR